MMFSDTRRISSENHNIETIFAYLLPAALQATFHAVFRNYSGYLNFGSRLLFFFFSPELLT